MNNASLDDNACIISKCTVVINDSLKVESTDTSTFDIIYWTLTAVIFTIGIPLNLGILHYERFGGDPQKRSLTNRILSRCGYIAICFWFSDFINSELLHKKRQNRRNEFVISPANFQSCRCHAIWWNHVTFIYGTSEVTVFFLQITN